MPQHEIITMIFRLYDGAWDDIIEGLEMRAQSLDEDPHCQKDADLVRELIKDFESLGSDILGGKIEGYRLTMTCYKTPKRIVEIRVVADD